MSDQRVHEAAFQWPTKREVNVGLIFCVALFALSLYTFVHPFAIYLLSGLCVLAIIYFLVALKIRESHFAHVYEDHIEFGTHFLRNKNSRIDITNIDTVRFSQSTIDKKSYGSVIIGSTGGAKLKIQSVRDPESFVEAIRNIKKERQSGKGSVAIELADLSRLLELGVITKKDFEAGKRKILGN
jgi:membrane protein YdbS with pleckstrin-like domain